MGVVTTKSTQISNRDATPEILSNNAFARGMVSGASDFAAVASGDSIGSYYPILSVPSNCRISSLKLTCDALTSTGAANIGVYKTTANGGAAVSASLFAAAQALTSALNDSQILNANGNFPAAKRAMFLWQILGLSADPNVWYDIGLALSAAAGGAGNVSLEVSYAQ